MTDKRQILAIDLLRFACALLVLAYHFGAAFGRAASPQLRSMTEIAALPDRWASWTWFGWVGVELFFVISGYVIAGSAAGSAPGAFLWRRVRRLLPAAWICASLSLVALWCAGADPAALPREWAASVFFWPVGPWIDPSYWTLGVELVFYMLVALVLRLPGGSRHLETLGWAIALWSIAFWFAALLGLTPAEAGQHRAFQLMLAVHGSLFALGIFARAVRDHGLTRSRWAAVLLCSAFGGVAIIGRAVSTAAALGLAASPLVPLALFGAGIVVVLGAQSLQPLIARAVPPGWAAAAGLATYPLYLLHQDGGGAAFVLLQRAGMAPVPAILAVAAGVVALSFAIALYAEPMLRRAIAPRRAPRRDSRPIPSP